MEIASARKGDPDIKHGAKGCAKTPQGDRMHKQSLRERERGIAFSRISGCRRGADGFTSSST